MSGGLNTEDLQVFTGSLMRFRHWPNRTVLYTPGVQYVAEKGEAFWLIDAIASHIGSPEFRTAAQKDDRIWHLHFWKLVVAEDRTATLKAVADSGELPFIEQAIPYTDFPLDSFDIWAGNDSRHWHLYLPSEH